MAEKASKKAKAKQAGALPPTPDVRHIDELLARTAAASAEPEPRRSLLESEAKQKT